MKVNFRQRAREALQRAKAELASGVDERLHYAALELRMASECVTYERAISYEEELPENVYDDWQPKKLMGRLLELDPLADQGGTLSFGLEDEPGVPSKEMKVLGTENVFSLRDIKRTYDALGSYLHQPTVKQLRGAGHDLQRLRVRCEQLAETIGTVLTSQVFNVNFGVFTTFNCMNSDCDKPIRKRLPRGQAEVAAECLKCGAEHLIHVGKDGQDIVVQPVVQDVPCADPNCGQTIKLFKHELRIGAFWRCVGCGKGNQLGLAVFAMDLE
jgi:hypothetical protein